MGATVRDESGHGVVVDAWLDRVLADVSAPQRLELLERALAAVWARAQLILGEVTLEAVADRVAFDAAERFPGLSAVTVDSTGFSFAGLRARPQDLRPEDVTAWTRFFLAEFLTVLGNLTADVLTPPLRDALASVAPPARPAAAVPSARESPTPAPVAKETKP